MTPAVRQPRRQHHRASRKLANETEATPALRYTFVSPRPLSASITTSSPLALSFPTSLYSLIPPAAGPGMGDESCMEEQSEQDGNGMDERRRSLVRDVAGTAGREGGHRIEAEINV